MCVSEEGGGGGGLGLGAFWDFGEWARRDPSMDGTPRLYGVIDVAPEIGRAVGGV